MALDLKIDLNDKKIIVLTGMMGVGKTTIGNKLAESAGFYFIDSDQEVEDQSGQSIAEIFKHKGEKYFRTIEKEAVLEILNRDEHIVLSLGGGAFMDEEVRDLIKEKAVSVWLYSDLETLLYRISAKNTRPLLNRVNKRKVLSDLIIQRYPTYKLADIHIDTGKANYDSLIKNIMKKISTSASGQISKEIVPVNLGGRSYDIVVGSGVVGEIAKRISQIKIYSKIIVIADDNAAKFHLETLTNNLKKQPVEVQTIIAGSGEEAKSFANLENILEETLQMQVDRNVLLIAFGGGVIGDLCGFVASILLRGVDFVQIPTTLLSAVDSSVGGKTAINSKSGKNLVGSFYQPKLVLCDLDFLETLPKRDFISGYAEVVKYGFIKDKNFFNYLENNLDKIINRDQEVLQKIIVKSCQIKAEIVRLDERENNLRAILNFGHTFGHVLEIQTKYSKDLSHGEAVSIGMVLAAKMSLDLGLLEKDHVTKITNHLKRTNLPTSIKDIQNHSKYSWKIERLIQHLYKDKKVENRKLTFILLEEIGKSVIRKEINESDFIKTISQEL
ncbi:MAG: shikimate kinase/3-dehydroquinate synthase [Myxococcota bacterium]|jgi:shikimate kinase/3-dehydroquinate synthase